MDFLNFNNLISPKPVSQIWSNCTSSLKLALSELYTFVHKFVMFFKKILPCHGHNLILLSKWLELQVITEWQKNVNWDMLEFKQNWKLIWIKCWLRPSGGLMTHNSPVSPTEKSSNVPLYFVFSGGNNTAWCCWSDGWSLFFSTQTTTKNITKKIKIKYKGTASSRPIGSFTWAIRFTGELRRN